MKELRVTAIKNGTVIDHIPADQTLKVVEILNLKDELVTIGMNLKSKSMKTKGIVKVAEKNLTEEEVNKIALVAPNATINIIKDYNAKKKTSVKLPKNVEGIINCINPNCITRNQKVKTNFKILNNKPLKLKCHHCETIVTEKEIIL